MIDPKLLEDFGAKMSALLAASPAKDIEKNARATLSGFFAKLDLVTREEFDIQADVLARTRSKLKELSQIGDFTHLDTDVLEKRVAALEAGRRE